MWKHAAVALGATFVMASAQAGEIYGNVGLPGVMIGYAQPINNQFAVRVDVASLGSINIDGTEEGIDYEGKARAHRLGLFGDWFVFGGGFRLTGGITVNDTRANLRAQGDGQTVTVGNNDYVLTSDDRIDVRVKFPRVTPYLGIGYGHQPSGTGWGFVFDLGASIGKARVSGEASGPVLSNDAAQEDFERELDEWRDGAGKVRAIPQISIGVNYRF
jgi:hypothetical protein